MASVAEEIFKLAGDTSDIIKKLKEVKGTYKELTSEQEQQIIQLGILEKKEKELLTARAKSNNPTAIIKYDNAITDTVKKIGALKEATDKFTQSEHKAAVEANALSSAVSNAFKGTTLAAASKEVEQIGRAFNGTEDSVGKVEVKAKSLRTQLKELKAELANEELDDGEFERLSIAAGKLQDRIEDAGDAARVFATDSPFEAVGNAIGSVGQKLLNLDFAGAAAQSQLLVRASQQITFGQALTGLKQLGTTIFNIGKALLTNPLFLIGGAILLIITNFEKLKTSGGLVGSVFRGIGDIVDGLISGFFALTDAIGLTSVALEKFNEAKINKLSTQLEDDISTLDRYIKAIKATGKDTEAAELQKQKVIEASSVKQLDLLRQIVKANGIASDDQKKQEKDLVNAILDARNETYVIEQDSLKKRKDAAKKYSDEVAKIFDDLDKKIREGVNKEAEFNIKFKFEENSTKQLEAVFALRKKLEDQELSELQKSSLKGLKVKADIEKAKEKLLIISKQTERNRTNDYNVALLDIELANGQKEIALQKEISDKLISVSNDSASKKANQSLTIEEDTYKAQISLLEENIEKRKALGLNTVAFEKQLNTLRFNNDVFLFNQEKELLNLNREEAEKNIDQDKAHENARLTLKNKANSTKLFADIKYERDRLEVLKEAFGPYSSEVKAQNDKILLAEKEAKKARILEVVGYFEQIVNAAVSATRQILAAKQAEVDGQIALQQKRIDEAKSIADRGNAELLELEQKRLDDLNKKRENYVRQQQALAAVELIANTAIAVSKAAAEGGVAAGITIAAALLALVAGLASARSIASQAAYYEGGYTGNGNPREESKAIGPRPYIYHKEEFVMNHQKTRKFRDIFEDVHAGKIDLHEWKHKASKYDQLVNHKSFSIGGVVEMDRTPVINNTIEFKQMQNQMDQLIWIMEHKKFGNDINFDEEGMTTRHYQIMRRKEFIKNSAKP